MSNIVPFNLLSAVAVLDSSLEGWKLLDVPASSARTHDLEITFERPFASTPLVHAGIVGFDVGNDDNLRVRVRVLDVTKTAFTLRVETWFDTRVWSVEVSWLAIGI